MKTTARVALVLLTLFGCVGCDQATKAFARSHLSAGQVTSLFHDTVRLEYTQNAGAFLSMGDQLSRPVRNGLFLFGAMVLVAAMLIWAFGSRRLGTVQTLGAALIAGGGLGNVIDRVSFDGNVVDFLNVGFGALRTGIFNVADMALMSGVALLIFTLHRVDTLPAGSRR